jgi:S-adenosylmethionine hydrolase
LESSFGTLEIAMRERSAKDFLGADLGEEVTLASA